ncbi:monocarboxylate transporter 9-like [Haliotis cracherodii]|uniref:monocarboxylate transporter 9-like n=1 Tax=Haliotis cracherodii TaxID=6455 RepID=UPI0039ED7C00
MGGVHDVVVLLANSWIRLFISGLKFTSGIFYVALLQEFKLTSGITSWITTLQYFVNAITCAVGGILVKRYGSRITTMAGGTIMFLGMLTSGFATKIEHVFITFGVVAGIGSGLTYIGSFEALKVSFTKHRNLAFGFGGFISSMGVVIYPPLLQYLIDTLYWRGMFQVMAALYLNIVVTAYLFPGRYQKSPDDDVDIVSDILTDIIVTERIVEFEPGDEVRVYEVDVGMQDDFSDDMESTSDEAPDTNKQDVQSIKLCDDNDLNTPPENGLGKDSVAVDKQEDSKANEQEDIAAAAAGEKESEHTYESISDDNAPEKRTDEDNTPEKRTDEDSAPEKSTDEHNTPIDSTYENFEDAKKDLEDDVTDHEISKIINTKIEANGHDVGVYNLAFEEIGESVTQDQFVDNDTNHQNKVIVASNKTFKKIAKDKKRRKSSVMEIEVIKHPSSRKKKWYKRLHGSLENSKGYYLFLLSGIISLFGGSILTGHLSAHILDYYHTDSLTASLSYTAFGLSAAVGKLLHGFLATNNRVNPAFLYIGFGVLSGLMTFVFFFDISLVVLYGYVVLFSICYASRGGAVLPAMMIRLAGEDNFALALGVYSLVTAVGYLIGAPIAGWVYDDTHSYKWPFVMSAISLTSSSLILLIPCGWKARS